ncbi:MAG: hypothetical protein ABW167_02185 [Baekduia sp.]
MLQLIDGIIVGYRHDLPSRADPDFRASAEVVIEVIDSTFWRVYARDRAITDGLQSNYDNVRLIEPEVVLPPVHRDS